MRSRALLALLVAAAVLGFAPARAEPAPGSEQRAESPSFDAALRVEVISCVLEESAVDVSEMLAIARAELAPHVAVRAGEQNSQPLLRVDACHDERLVLKLLAPEGPEQSIALHDVPPEHRPRVAALALAELVLTARTVGEWRAERAAKSEAGAERAQAEAEGAAEAARFPDWNAQGPAAPLPHPMRLGIGVEARLFTDSLSFSYGPRVTLRLARVDLTLLGLVSRRGVPHGTFHTGLVAVNAAVHLWRTSGALDFAISLGAEVGVSWGRAEPNVEKLRRERSQTPSASVFGQLTLGGAISQQAYAHALLSAGYAVPGVQAHEQSERAGTQGAYVGLSAGFTWLL